MQLYLVVGLEIFWTGRIGSGARSESNDHGLLKFPVRASGPRLEHGSVLGCAAQGLNIGLFLMPEL
jgi:hypothetical protein